jgi:hypothetical protein
MRIYLTPSCAVVPDVPNVVRNFSRKSMNANWDGIALGAFAPATWLQPNYISWRSMMDNFNPGWNQGFSDGVHNVLQATFKAPKLIIQPLTPIQLGTNGVTTYDFNVQNVSNLASANSSFIYIDSTVGGMRVLNVYALPGNTLIPKTGNIYKLGSIPAVTTRSYRVQLQFSKCTYDSIKLVAGWNCQGYPAADLYVNYPCKDLADSSAKFLYVIPQDANLQTRIVTEPNTTVAMCADVPYEFEVKNVQFGYVYLQKCTLQIPVGYGIKSGTSMVRWPNSGSYVTISNPVQISGNRFVWNVAPYLGAESALHSTADVDSSFMRIKFDLTTFCDPQFISGKRLIFTTNGVTYCGKKVKGFSLATLPSIITGSTIPYSAILTTPRKTDLVGCGQENTIFVRFLNLGANNTAIVDSIFLTLPQGMNFVPGSVNPLVNISNPVPDQDLYAGQPRLKWRVDQGIQPFDSAFWSFRVTIDPTFFSCDTQLIQLESVVSDSVICSTTSAVCYIKSATGSNIEKFNISKPILTLSNFTGNANCSPGAGEQVNLTTTVTNTGPPISAGTAVVIAFYRDINNNGTYESGVDSFLISTSFATGLGTNASQTVSVTSTTPRPGLGCALLAVIDNQGAYKNCVCDVNALSLRNIPLVIAGNDTTVCSGASVNLGTGCVVPGYTYSWSPATGLSSTNTANTVFNRTNTTGVNQVYTYYLQINRAGCLYN